MNDHMRSGASAPKNDRPVLILYILIFLVFFLLSVLTPFVSDDFAYCFSWADWTRITRIGQIIPSMAVHRDVTNGRVIVHGIVQFLLLMPRPVYAVLNALNAVLLCIMLRRLIRLPSMKQELPVLLFSVFYLFCFLPALGENLLWRDGSVNYFWGLTCSLLFLLPFLADYLDQPRSESLQSAVLRILLAFVFGTWSETLSLIVLFLAACFWLLAWKRSRKFRLFPLLWILAALAGYLFLMTAPATAGRAGATSVSVIGYNFRAVFRAAQTYLLWPLLIWAVLFSLGICFHADLRLLTASLLLLIGGLLSLLFYVFAAYFVPRHLCGTVFLLMLATVLLLAALCRAERAVFSSAACAALSVLFLLQFPVGVLDVAVSYHKEQLRTETISSALASGKTDVILENYIPYTSYAVPFELNPADPTVGPNINIADYYGLDSILGIDPPGES